MAVEAQGSTSRRRYSRVAVLAGAVVLASVGYVLWPGPVAVHVAQASREAIAGTITTNGKIEAVNRFDAYAREPAMVKRVLVSVGQRVQRGQLLVELTDADTRAYEARAVAQLRAAEADLDAIDHNGNRRQLMQDLWELRESRNNLAEARQTLSVTRTLAEMGVASTARLQSVEQNLGKRRNSVLLLQEKVSARYSPIEREQVTARVEQAKAEYEWAQQRVAERSPRSPVAGAVSWLPVRPGQFVRPGDLLARVADGSEVVVRVFVDESDLGRLFVGQKVTVTWDGLPDRTWSGAVTRLPVAVVARGTRSVGEMAILVENADGMLLDNASVHVSVTMALKENALTVPRAAVRQHNGETYLFLVTNGRLQRQLVTTGIADSQRVEITSSLSVGAMVATESAEGAQLREGMRVRVLR